MMIFIKQLCLLATATVLISGCAAEEKTLQNAAQGMVLVQEVKITDAALFFDGKRIDDVQDAKEK